MSTVTRLLSRLIGVYCVIVSLAMASHRSATVETITAMVHNTPLLFLSGIIAVVTGLAIVLNHNVWSGGATPVIVTLIGWVTLLKGTLFLDGLHFSQLFFVYCGIAFAMGAWLTWSGFSFRNNSC